MKKEALLAKCRAVSERAAQTRRIGERNHWLLDIALDHLTLGRAALYAAILESRTPAIPPARPRRSPAPHRQTRLPAPEGRARRRRIRPQAFRRRVVLRQVVIRAAMIPTPTSASRPRSRTRPCSFNANSAHLDRPFTPDPRLLGRRMASWRRTAGRKGSRTLKSPSNLTMLSRA